jgi:hydrogenase maturation protease
VSTATSPIREAGLVERIADAVLYEGYILYPYRPSAVKNQQRWNFGVLCPESYAIAQHDAESSTMCTECLIEADSSTTIDLKIRFLHLMMREVAEVIEEPGRSIPDCEHVLTHKRKHFVLAPSLEVDGMRLQKWQEAVEREVVVPEMFISEAKQLIRFEFPANRTLEEIKNKSGTDVGLIARTQQALKGEIEISITKTNTQSTIGNRKLLRLSINIRNLSAFEDAAARTRDEALMHSLVSTHTILKTQNGAFVSLLDQPEEYKQFASECRNTGTYPVLVGQEGDRDCVLSSPIILYDYPQIAPQSAGNLFDGTEIDEILTLRIMSLTDDEKTEMRNADELARQLLERTESLSLDQMMNLHGVMTRKS